MAHKNLGVTPERIFKDNLQIYSQSGRWLFPLKT